jgi:hypothetical protein
MARDMAAFATARIPCAASATESRSGLATCVSIACSLKRRSTASRPPEWSVRHGRCAAWSEPDATTNTGFSQAAAADSMPPFDVITRMGALMPIERSPVSRLRR